MRIGIVTDPPDRSAYVGEILTTWGIPFHDRVDPPQAGRLDPRATPVLVFPKAASTSVLDYARAGGTAVCFVPDASVAGALGLEDRGEKAAPLRLRVTGATVPGLAGELLPVLGRVRSFHKSSNDVSTLAYLNQPYGFEDESIGVAERPVGKGRVIVFAFDLPQCVMLLRQGDPARAEWFPPYIPPQVHYSKTMHLAAEIGPGGAGDGWIPYADILAHWFADLVRRSIPAPVPILSHLPGDASAIVLYSGDEDNADVAWNDEEFAAVTDAGARMNLYVIPTATQSLRADIARYQQHHDIGAHPDLRALDRAPIPERLAEYERQVRMLREQLGARSLTTRHHCLTWAGYTDIVEVQQRLGIRMDANFIGGPAYYRHKESAPYFGFGAAMPMRFSRVDGTTLDVLQQHTHVEDDMWFGEHIEYSLKLSPQTYRAIFARMLDDSIARFHSPIGVNFHPSNWVKFSRDQGIDTLRLARARGVPVWSFDQWSEFWQARDSWRFDSIEWNGRRLTVRTAGLRAHTGLRVWLPARHGGLTLESLRGGGKTSPIQVQRRFSELVAPIPICDPDNAEIIADYRTD